MPPPLTSLSLQTTIVVDGAGLTANAERSITDAMGNAVSGDIINVKPMTDPNTNPGLIGETVHARFLVPDPAKPGSLWTLSSIGMGEVTP